MGRIRGWIVVAAVVLLAGCVHPASEKSSDGAGSSAHPSSGTSGASPHRRPDAGGPSASSSESPESPRATSGGPFPVGNPNPGAVRKPDAFTAPVFGRVAEIPKSSGGEPNIAAAPDGTLYVSYAGCAGDACVNNPLHRSLDDGRTWTYLNRGDGHLGGPVHSGWGDADVAVDADGTVYAFDMVLGDEGLTGDILFRSRDRGATWDYLGNLVPDQQGGDRAWIAASGSGHLVANWNEGGLVVRTSHDAGSNFSKARILDANINVEGPAAFDPTGERAYIPYIGGGAVRLARSLDGGETWETLDTGFAAPQPLLLFHFFGGFIFPVLDVTSDGRLALVWSAARDPLGSLVKGVGVFLSVSSDEGRSWSPAVEVATRGMAVFPWVAAGAEDRVAVSYYATDLAADPSIAYAQDWDVEVAVVDGIGEPAPNTLRTVVEKAAHQGPICTDGTGCAVSDRSVLDFFEMDTLPDGRLALSYVADTGLPGPAHGTVIKTGVQTDGTPLWVFDQ